MTTTLRESDRAELKHLLVGRRIEGIHWPKLFLDNGRVLEVEGNEGCGGCSAGHFAVTQLHTYNNVIANVLFSDDTDRHGNPRSYSVFVYADGESPSEILRVEGDVGNGYYGYGYTIRVKEVVDDE